MLQYRILNAVLTVISTYNSFPRVERVIVTEVFQLLNERGLQEYMVVNAIKKALKDGFIEAVIEIHHNELFNKNDELTIYNITWEGQFFISEGGYIGRHQRETSEKRRLDAVEQQTRMTNKQMVTLTLFVAIGTSIAALYYLLEIVCMFCSRCIFCLK